MDTTTTADTNHSRQRRSLSSNRNNTANASAAAIATATEPSRSPTKPDTADNGGFRGTESSINGCITRDGLKSVYETIISGDIGKRHKSSFNCYLVLTFF
eukprot:19724_1